MSARTQPLSGTLPVGAHPQSPALLQALLEHTLDYIGLHADSALTRVRAHLLDLVDARPLPSQAQNMRSAAVLLQRQAGRFVEALQEALRESLQDELRVFLPQAPGAAVRKFTPADPIDGMSLSLIDVVEVERILLVDRVAQRFSSVHEAAVNALGLRLAALLDRAAVDLSANPFRPEVLVRSFLLAWERCALDLQASEDLMLALHPLHSFDLTDLYSELNAHLAQAGVAERPVARIHKTENAAGAGPDHAADAAPSAVQGAAQEQPAQATPGWPGFAPLGRSLAAHARTFLRRIGLGSGTGSAQADTEDEGSPTAFENQPADPQFMGYLGYLQADAGTWSAAELAQQPDPAEHNILRRLREREEVRRAPELDRGTVDALAEVFDFVFADQTIPLQMKYVIGRLQIPVLKAAMIDRDFFLSTEHPARRLVDTLAQASVAWAPEKGEQDPLYVRIESTVQRVLHEFEDDLALFSDLLLEFSTFLFETEQQAQVRIEPKAREEDQGERLEQARARADEAVHARLSAVPAGQALVPFLVPFITHQWRDVLARVALTEPADAPAWTEALQTLERLIWSTLPKTNAQERGELVQWLPNLVRALNAGLDAIEWTGQPRATFTRRLIATHMLAIRMKAATEPDAAALAQEEAQSKEALQALEQRRSDQLAGSVDDFDAQAQSFGRGMWFEFVVDDSTRHRYRLSWVSPMRTRLLFTNREGHEAFVRSEREVAALLRHGRLRSLEQQPIVGRAIEHILVDVDLQAVA